MSRRDQNWARVERLFPERFSESEVLRSRRRNQGLYTAFDRSLKRRVFVKSELIAATVDHFTNQQLWDIFGGREPPGVMLPLVISSDVDEQRRTHEVSIWELTPYGDLFTVISDRKVVFDEGMGHRLFSELVNGWLELRKRELIHLDLKPENLLLTAQFRLKIIDFEFMVRCPAGHQLSNIRRGSPSYIAPEMYRLRRASEKSDIWSLGQILFSLLVGHPANHYYEYGPDDFWFHVLTDRGFSNEVRDLIEKMMTVDASKRIGAAELASHPWLKKRFPGAGDRLKAAVIGGSPIA